MYILFFVIYLICVAMRFIKRLIFVLLLLVIAFFIYRLISPQSAQQLLYDLKLSSNSTLGTQFPLSGEVIVTSWVVLDLTGVLVEDTWALQEITGDEELLLSDFELLLEDDRTWTVTTTWATSLPVSSWIVVPQPLPVVPAKTVTTPKTIPSSSKTLSPQEQRDLANFLQNFGN
jgi:hypothetical protein